jgi:hypothetical protein
MPIVPCFDPSTGASGGPQGGGGVTPGGNMPPWETLGHIKFKNQTPADYTNLFSPVSFSLTDESGRIISGDLSRNVTNQNASRQGWDTSRGFYTELIDTATNSSVRMALPLTFAPGVTVNQNDDVRVTLIGRINLPSGGNNCYWLPAIPFVSSEGSGSYGIKALRLAVNAALLNFRAGSSSSPNIDQSQGFPLDAINGSLDVEVVLFWPRYSTRPYCTFRKVGEETFWEAYMGQDSQGTSLTPVTVTSYYSNPSPWQGKDRFHLLHSSYNGAVNGFNQQFSHIYEVKFERRTLP